MGSTSGTRAVVAALIANTGIAVAKFIGFLITRSSAMLAESVHSVADAVNQMLLLLGGRRSQRPPTEIHPFGYGRERYFWSFVVALVLFSMGSAFAIYEGIEKLHDPHALDQVGWAIGILILGLILESFSMRTAILEANQVKGNVSWSKFVLRSKQPELPVVLLEDAGALIGLVIALATVTTAHITDEPRWDGVGTLAIGVLLGLIAVLLAREMHSLLIGEAASTNDQSQIANAIETSDAVDRLVALRTQHLGPDEILVGVKVVFHSGLDAPGVAEAIDGVESLIHKAVPAAGPIFVEPVLPTEPEAPVQY
ncbi:MAG: cation diffusion facilitator family transporter [Actinomycetota bacterium]|nr:cation diffusion facilitator family transporter [Actinomycetota bacterium]